MATKKPYAYGTPVSIETSLAEIRKLVARLGAVRFMSGEEPGRHLIGFEAHGRQVRFEITIPDGADQKEIMRRWRGLVLRIKSKVVAVEDEIVEFEEEFLNEIVLADGRTFGQFAIPQIQSLYESKKMPALLPGVIEGEVEG